MGEKKKILMVDDVALNHATARDVLGDEYDLYEVYSGAETFEKLKYYVKHNFALEKDLKEKYAKFFYYKKDIRKRLTDEIEKICNEENNK